jgi:hypothetical protein
LLHDTNRLAGLPSSIARAVSVSDAELRGEPEPQSTTLRVDRGLKTAAKLDGPTLTER